jgi:hypothetical protein
VLMAGVVRTSGPAIVGHGVTGARHIRSALYGMKYELMFRRQPQVGAG